MKKMLVLLLAIVMFTASCMAHRHVIGNGPQTGVKMERRQWYAVWGLVPIGEVDVAQLSNGAKDYEIYTRENAADFFINLFTSWVTIVSRTVTVTR